MQQDRPLRPVGKTSSGNVSRSPGGRSPGNPSTSRSMKASQGGGHAFDAQAAALGSSRISGSINNLGFQNLKFGQTKDKYKYKNTDEM